jgi:hypothetical protein
MELRKRKIILLAAFAAALTTDVTFTVAVNDASAAGAEVRDHRPAPQIVVRDHRNTVVRDHRDSSPTSNATAPRVKSGLQQFKDKVGKTSAGKNLFDRPTPAAASAQPASAPPAAALPPAARSDETTRDHRKPTVTTAIQTDHRAGQDHTTYQVTTIRYPNGKTVIKKEAVKKKKEERETPCSSWPFCF